MLVLTAGGRVVVLLYVDDGLISAPTAALLAHWRTRIMAMYKARDLGEPADYLNICLERDRNAGTLRMHQRPYIERLALLYPPAPARLPATPLPTAVLPIDGERLSSEELQEYPSLVGALNYLACCTRPDISHAVSTLSRFLKCPRQPHHAAALRVLHYVHGTSALALTFSRAHSPAPPIGFCDADYAGDTPTRRSTTGIVFLWGGAAVAWQSKLQSTVALSTTEAELQAISAAAREALWLRKILPAVWGEPWTSTASLGTRLSDSPSAAADAPPPAKSPPLEIMTDSQSALALVKTVMMTARSKHIDVIHFFARERVRDGEIAFSFVGTAANVADGLTKAVPPQKAVFCRTGCGLL